MTHDPLLAPLMEGLPVADGRDLARALLERTALSEERIEEQLATKIEHKSLLLHPAGTGRKETPEARADTRRIKALKERRRLEGKRKPRPLSSRERKASGWGNVCARGQNYDIYKGLHDLWTVYMRQVLGLPIEGSSSSPTVALGTPATMDKLLKADYHGAVVRVVKSSCPSLVFIGGIIVKETRHTFVICTKSKGFRTVPKESAVFEFELLVSEGTTHPPLIWEIYGEFFGHRSADRVGRKFKGRGTIDFGR
ncbi:RNase P/RNase MRP complex subunit [Savitreella phatthalungensis]